MRINSKIFTKKAQERGYVDVRFRGMDKEAVDAVLFLLGLVATGWLIFAGITSIIIPLEERQYWLDQCKIVNRGAESYVREDRGGESKWVCKNLDNSTESFL